MEYAEANDRNLHDSLFDRLYEGERIRQRDEWRNGDESGLSLQHDKLGQSNDVGITYRGVRCDSTDQRNDIVQRDIHTPDGSVSGNNHTGNARGKARFERQNQSLTAPCPATRNPAFIPSGSKSQTMKRCSGLSMSMSTESCGNSVAVAKKRRI